MISRVATASVIASAFCKNDIAASFFSDPGLSPVLVASATLSAPFDPSVTFNAPAATADPLAPTNAGQVITSVP